MTIELTLAQGNAIENLRKRFENSLVDDPVPMIGGGGAVVVAVYSKDNATAPFIWIAVEPDGYCHS